MKIKDKLTFLFSSLIGILLLIFSVVIYVSSSNTREEEYFKSLKQQAATKAHLLFDAKVEPSVLQLIYKNTPNILNEEEVAIYDTSFHLLYHDAVDIDKVKETKVMVDKIARLKEMRLYIGDFQAIGFLYQHAGKNYIITAAAKDEYGYKKLFTLRTTLIISFCVSIILILFAGRFFAKQALNPVSDLVDKVKKITATNLDLRVNEGNKRDEIAELAVTFNKMLNRLESSFDSQKHFVSNISHELRTPLSAMLAELEITLDKDRNIEEYKESISHAIDDGHKIVKLSNSLLDLAKASYDASEISFKNIRVDELLVEARNDVMHINNSFKINIAFENESIENDDLIMVYANEYLLKVAFINLMENACKFSNDKYCDVTIVLEKNRSKIKFRNKGIGIPEEDLPNIFNSFYRGANRKYADGNGIGLSLTKKIISLHKGDISVLSTLNDTTVFTVLLPSTEFSE